MKSTQSWAEPLLCLLHQELLACHAQDDLILGDVAHGKGMVALPGIAQPADGRWCLSLGTTWWLSSDVQAELELGSGGSEAVGLT